MPFFPLWGVRRWQVLLYKSTHNFITHHHHCAGRHVLGTLIDLSEKLAQDIQQKRKIPKIHMTLVDIHPVSLARVLMVLDLLRQLSESRDTPDRLELEAALSFLYVSIVVPDYSHELCVISLLCALPSEISQNYDRCQRISYQALTEPCERFASVAARLS